MERLGYPMPLVLRVNMIHTSLSKDYDQFVQNYNMHGMGKTIPELHAMLKLAEKGIPKKTLAVLAIMQESKKNKASTSGTSGIFTIELFSFPKSNSWIYDTGCGTHICNTIQGLRGYRKLNKGALDLYVGNGNSAAIEAIGSYALILPSRMILVLDNYNGAISVSKDNICYFNTFPRDGIFEIDMHNHISNERSIYTCSNKKTKHNLDSTFLCRLSHINEKCIAKFKMARKPFTHASERVDDLLGLMHSDVCGPFRTTSREGAKYYVTFTDGFSRYGHVHLININMKSLKCSRHSKTK
ncbi:hypothetical protein Tco_1566262 [Tanacetum coccineum]